MGYEVLARKWRPQIFDDVIGQGHITRTLMNAIKNDRLAHAYLFSGARGVGKTSVARILAKALNCLERDPGIPCNRCNSCVEITGGSSVDVQEIDGASNRGIDEIRELRENIKYMPSSGHFRVYIIDEVHMLTKEAFNALLKTLEEPPAHVKFIFATTEPHKVPVTILSRCQRFDFKRIPMNQIVSQLEKIVEDEGIEITRGGISIIANKAEGSMRDAESLLDQVISFTGVKAEEKDITEILGVIDRTLIMETSDAILQGASDECIEIAGRVYNNGYDIREFYRALMEQFRNLLVSLIAPDSDLLDMVDSEKDELGEQAKKAGEERLQQSLNLLIAREEDLRYSLQPKLVLETIMIKLSRMGEVLSFNDIIRKIEALEKRLADGMSHRISSETVSDPGKAWEKRDPGVDKKTAFQKEKKEDKREGKGLQNENDWPGLMSYIAAKNRAMSSILKNWRCVSSADDLLEIEKGGNAFSASYLDDPEKMDKFIGFCRDYYKRDIRVKITGNPDRVNDNSSDNSSGNSGSIPGKPPEDSKLNRQGNPGIPQEVQEVARMFDGEVREELTKPKG